MKLPLVLLTAAALGAVGCAGRASTSAAPVDPSVTVHTTSAPVVVTGAASDSTAPPAAQSDVSATASASPAPAASGGSPPAKRDDSMSPKMARDYGWISIGVGAFAGVIALGTSGVSLHAAHVRSANCNEHNVCNSAGINANEDLKTIFLPNAVAWGVAIVGVGLGAYLLITHPADRNQQTAIGIAPTGSGTGLTLRSTF